MCLVVRFFQHAKLAVCEGTKRWMYGDRRGQASEEGSMIVELGGVLYDGPASTRALTYAGELAHE